MEEQTLAAIAALVYIKDRKLLVVRSYGQGTWHIPGGKSQNSETDVQFLHRKIQEELGVALQEGSVLSFSEFKAQTPGQAQTQAQGQDLDVDQDNPPATKLLMKCYTAVIIGEPRVSAGVEELSYFDTSERGRMDPAGQLVLDDLAAKNLVD